MATRLRSISGLVIALLCLPAFISLMACIPVPLGDPERSTIDPEISGLWVVDLDGPGLALFEPFDRHSWLLTMVSLENVGCSGDDEIDADDDESGEQENEWSFYDELVQAIDAAEAGCDPGEVGDTVLLFKAWRTRLGGQWFMTWEPLGNYDPETGFADEIWYGMRVDKLDADRVRLRVLDADYDGFDSLEALDALQDQDTLPYDERVLRRARRAFERVVSRSVADDDLYLDDAWRMRRVAPEYHSDFADIFDDRVEGE